MNPNKSLPQVSVRTEFIDYDARSKPKTERFCIKCQRDIRLNQPVRQVFVTREMHAVHPEDVKHYMGDSLGWNLIGLDCAKNLGMEWSIPGQAMNNESKPVAPEVRCECGKVLRQHYDNKYCYHDQDGYDKTRTFKPNLEPVEGVSRVWIACGYMHCGKNTCLDCWPMNRANFGPNDVIEGVSMPEPMRSHAFMPNKNGVCTFREGEYFCAGLWNSERHEPPTPAPEGQRGDTTLTGKSRDEWVRHIDSLFAVAIPGEDIPETALLYGWQGVLTDEDRTWAKAQLPPRPEPNTLSPQEEPRCVYCHKNYGEHGSGQYDGLCMTWSEREMLYKPDGSGNKWVAAPKAVDSKEEQDGEQELREIVDRQAEDEGLWCRAKTAPEAYLQQELRKLHAAVENRTAKSVDSLSPEEPTAENVYIHNLSQLISSASYRLEDAGSARELVAEFLEENHLRIVAKGSPSEEGTGWIDCKQRMPPEREIVLGFFQLCGVYVTSWFKWETMERPLWGPGLREWGDVTHWMPLPQPPEAK